ncbi:uncharacterized protein LOC106775176 isoform X5 [Vigna radiata var. radiata]|uniref:Uncharacterized protein LOC106775176 isoform X5 n=1 Tax=Vigna radiata var. radiata TaxID=3916 RepID=A0A3Q0FIX4_VIGRR|nr:uncharacterized protein LOC106775176 isoform X5 [Vigna radiata var. radiata]
MKGLEFLSEAHWPLHPWKGYVHLVSWLATITLGLEYCNLMCYKDPVLKDQQWSAYIDRSPGAASYSALDRFGRPTFFKKFSVVCASFVHISSVTENSVPLILSVHVPVYKMISLWNVFMLVYLVAVTSLT